MGWSGGGRGAQAGCGWGFVGVPGRLGRWGHVGEPKARGCMLGDRVSCSDWSRVLSLCF